MDRPLPSDESVKYLAECFGCDLDDLLAEAGLDDRRGTVLLALEENADDAGLTPIGENRLDRELVAWVNAKRWLVRVENASGAHSFAHFALTAPEAIAAALREATARLGLDPEDPIQHLACKPEGQ